MSISLWRHGWQHARLRCSSLSPQSFLRLMSTESALPSSHLILRRPLLLLPSIFPSIRVFPNELILHIRWPKYWSFSFSISPFNECLGLISFRIDWFDLLVVSGVFSSTRVWRHQPSLWSNSHIHTWLLEKKNIACYYLFCWSKRDSRVKTET